MLTKKQLELLRFIHDRMSKEGVPPSFDEMKDALSLASKSGIHRLISALEERGYIRRLANRARAIEIVRLPDGLETGKRSVLNVVEGGKSKDRNDRPIPANDTGGVTIPVMGRIAAGSPISAIQQATHDVVVSPDLLAPGEHYALEVRGDSMIGAGILDGDTVVIRKSDTARDGEIVVALVDEEEATLKRLHREQGRIALHAANPEFETRVFEPGRVKVQGKLAGLIRRYN